jgi:hypothetical protein
MLSGYLLVCDSRKAKDGLAVHPRKGDLLSCYHNLGCLQHGEDNLVIQLRSAWRTRLHNERTEAEKIL